MTPIKTPESHDTAGQCREMGLVVGDVIQGREHYGEHWRDSRLTLIFISEEVAVFKEECRNSRQPDWRDYGESACWTLNCRQWHKIGSAA